MFKCLVVGYKFHIMNCNYKAIYSKTNFNFIFKAMRSRNKEGQISTIKRTPEADVLFPMLQTQKIGVMYNEGRKRKIFPNIS